MPSLYRCAVNCAIALLLGCGISGAVAAEVDRIPDGWNVYSTTRPDDSALHCASAMVSSTRAVSVTEEGALHIETTDGNEAGYRQLKVRDGLLEGEDQGEWGGGLSWVSPDSRTRIEISHDNVRGLPYTSFGTLTLTGLDHLGIRSGAVLSIATDEAGQPTATVDADLGESPRAFTFAPDGTVVIVTASRLFRVSAPDVVDVLFSVDYGLTHPASVAATPSGSIYVRMRHFVTRLAPRGASYQEDWLAPADCLHIGGNEPSCPCFPDE